MRSFILACVTIVVVAVGGHYVIDEFDPIGPSGSPNASVRLD
ncbi:hypothetical protein [Aliiruegeria lutimaris]|uniref:Uncharacterized protein n=1 Tax=Aliiruegeria lutimaris TaxID=571298 RepID=A0A1G9D0I8_9RHOB|nr:hypothetical protein [Aliiruegeria lutimaris]SDK57426.1 hypothetical protein SAMN04488026_104521 [Aliiruegeria lutimaris]